MFKTIFRLVLKDSVRVQTDSPGINLLHDAVQVHTHPNILQRCVVIDKMEYDPVTTSFPDEVGSNIFCFVNLNQLLAKQFCTVRRRLPKR